MIQPKYVVRIYLYCPSVWETSFGSDPKSQNRPIAIKIKASVSPQEIPFRRRYNLKKVDWEGLATSVDMGITDIIPSLDNYGTFVDLVKNASRQNIPRGCRTSYICGLTDKTKEVYEDHKMQFQDDLSNSETIETDNMLSDEIA